MKLYPFQEAILKELETKSHVHVETGQGKALILLEYAKRHPEAKILISTNPSMLSQYQAMIEGMKISNVILVT